MRALSGFLHAIALESIRWLFGYGERPLRLALFVAFIVFAFAAAYYGLGLLTPGSFLDCLYFSAVSFTALGYGEWAPHPQGLAKGLGAAEAFFGILALGMLIALLGRKLVPLR